MTTMKLMTVAGLMVLALNMPRLAAAEPDVSSMTSEQRKAYFKEQIALKRIRDAHAAAAAGRKPADDRAAAFYNEKTTVNAGSLGPTGGLAADVREKGYAIIGTVSQVLKDGVLVRCEDSLTRTNGLRRAKGLVMLRGVSAAENSVVKTHGYLDGSFVYDAQSGPRRVLAYRLAR